MQLKHHKLRLPNGKGLKVGLVVSRFNENITTALLDAALATLQQAQVSDKNIKVISVPGAMEIPYVLQQLARTKKYDCLVALGCVIRGETPHFDYVCKMAQEGVLEVSLDFDIPIGFGVMTVNNLKQAKTRIHVASEAVAAALEITTID
jgi:6,7-dimethyl-8-ribityllumazine synthase